MLAAAGKHKKTPLPELPKQRSVLIRSFENASNCICTHSNDSQLPAVGFIQGIDVGSLIPETGFSMRVYPKGKQMKAVALTHYLPIVDPNSLMDVGCTCYRMANPDRCVGSKA